MKKKKKTQAGVHLRTLLCEAFFFKKKKILSPNAAPFLMQKIGETDGIVFNHDNCSWPQLMIANNPNECYTIFKIAILFPARRLAENVNCYANLLSSHK